MKKSSGSAFERIDQRIQPPFPIDVAAEAERQIGRLVAGWGGPTFPNRTQLDRPDRGTGTDRRTGARSPTTVLTVKSESALVVTGDKLRMVAPAPSTSSGTSMVASLVPGPQHGVGARHVAAGDPVVERDGLRGAAQPAGARAASARHAPRIDCDRRLPNTTRLTGHLVCVGMDVRSGYQATTNAALNLASSSGLMPIDARYPSMPSKSRSSMSNSAAR